MKFTGGLNRDADPFSLQDGEYTYASNATISELLGSLENLPDNVVLPTFNLNELLIGWVLSDIYIYVFTYHSAFDTDPNTDGSIGKVYRADGRNPTSFTPIIEDPYISANVGRETVLGFEKQVSYDVTNSRWKVDQLDLVSRINDEDEELIVVSGEDKPLIINMTILSSGVIPNDISGLSKEHFLLSPEASIPAIEAQVKEDGGSLFSGAWFFTYKYEYADGSSSDWATMSNPSYVSQADLQDYTNLASGAGLTIQGDDGNNITNKSIKLNFDIDLNQPANDYIRIGYVSVRQGVTYAGILAKKTIKSLYLYDSFNLPDVDKGISVYTGEQPEFDLGDSILELIAPNNHFKKAQTITSLSERLYVGNFEIPDKSNLQLVANDIVVRWNVNDGSSWVNKGYWSTRPMFGYGEIYALYMHALYKDGTMSKGYHIPGRKSIAGLVLSVDLTNGGFSYEGGVSGVINGTGTGATVNVFQKLGVVTGVVVTAQGSGYDAATTITITGVQGSGGLATAVLTADVVTSIIVDDGGLTYFSVPTINITGGGGTGAVATAIVAGGVITSITVDAGGLGYTTAPTIGISGGGGGGATADVNVIENEDSPFFNDLYFQVDDTALVASPGSTVANPTGYWRNEDEFYPQTDDFPVEIDDLNVDPAHARKVRHHKMPSLGFLYREGLSDGPFDPKRLTLSVSNIDLSGQDEIDGFMISYAKRSIGDQVNLAYDWPHSFGNKRIDGSNSDLNLVSIPGNWAGSNEFGDASSYDFDRDIQPNSKFLKFHALQLLSTNPSINPKYVSVEKRYVKRPVDNSVLMMDSKEYVPVGVITADQEKILPFAYMYAKISQENLTSAESSLPDNGAFNRYFEIYDHAYIKNGVQATLYNGSVSPPIEVNIDNKAGEDTLVISTSPGAIDDNFVATADRFGNPFEDPENLNKGIAPFIFMALKAVPKNISAPFTNQTLVHARSFNVEEIIDLNSSFELFNGDQFNGATQWHTTGVSGNSFGYAADGTSNDTPNTIEWTTDEQAKFFGEGRKISYILPMHSPINHNLQSSDVSNYQELLVPITGSVGDGHSSTISHLYDVEGLAKAKTWTFFQQDISQSFSIRYNTDFSRLSEYIIWGIYDGQFDELTKFPISIQYSQQEVFDDDVIQWRRWPLGNRYTQPPDKGKIIKLQGAGNNKLYIHHEFSLYITKDRAALQTGDSEIVLGSSNIFTVIPQEIITVDNGYLGLFNKNWSDMNVMGYCWPNIESGKVFVHNGSELKEISANGMRVFFRDLLTTYDTSQIALNDQHISIYFDEFRKRLVFSNRAVSLSYSSMTSKWISFHDNPFMIPLITRSNIVLAIEGTEIVNETEFTTPITLNFGGYNNSTAKPFIIESVIAIPQIEYNYLQSINWNSFVSDNDLDIDESFNKVLVYSSTKTTGEMALVKYIDMANPGNTRRVEKVWHFNALRDIWDGATKLLGYQFNDRYSPGNNGVGTPTWDRKSRMKDIFFLVRLIYDKEDDYRIVMSEIDFKLKQSKR